MATQATTRKNQIDAALKAKATILLEKAYDLACDETVQGAVRMGAMKLFLSKTMPDLKAIEHSGEVDLQITAIEVQVLDSTSPDS